LHSGIWGRIRELGKKKNREVAGYCYRGQRRRRRCEPTPQSAHRSRSCHGRGTRWQIERCLKLGESRQGCGTPRQVGSRTYSRLRVQACLLFFFVAKHVFTTLAPPAKRVTGGKSDFLMFRFSRKKTEKQVDCIWSRVLCLATSLIMHAFHMCVPTTPNL
jgi:hypothetical protein